MVCGMSHMLPLISVELSVITGHQPVSSLDPNRLPREVKGTQGTQGTQPRSLGRWIIQVRGRPFIFFERKHVETCQQTLQSLRTSHRSCQCTSPYSLSTSCTHSFQPPHDLKVAHPSARWRGGSQLSDDTMKHDKTIGNDQQPANNDSFFASPSGFPSPEFNNKCQQPTAINTILIWISFPSDNNHKQEPRISNSQPATSAWATFEAKVGAKAMKAGCVEQVQGTNGFLDGSWHRSWWLIHVA